jgi:hypothetical protein
MKLLNCSTRDRASIHARAMLLIVFLFAMGLVAHVDVAAADGNPNDVLDAILLMPSDIGPDWFHGSTRLAQYRADRYLSWVGDTIADPKGWQGVGCRVIAYPDAHQAKLAIDDIEGSYYQPSQIAGPAIVSYQQWISRLSGLRLTTVRAHFLLSVLVYGPYDDWNPAALEDLLGIMMSRLPL